MFTNCYTLYGKTHHSIKHKNIQSIFTNRAGARLGFPVIRSLPKPLSTMTGLRFLICCSLSALACAAWAGGAQTNVQASDDRPVDRNDPGIHKQEKFAGRANSQSNEVALKNPNAKYPSYTTELHDKKPLSKEEKRALRRQINETEIMYPKKN
ncbi:hypothetical protein AAKU67_001471 [Oxalobacteraceae bacterium GrIS 2.11]